MSCRLHNTDKLFTPGKFLFNTRIKNTISVKIIDHITPGRCQGSSLHKGTLEQRVRQAFDEIQA